MVPDGEFGSNFGNGKSGGFGCQSGTSGYPWVHFDNNHFTGFRVEPELDIGSSGFNTDSGHNYFSCIPHGLVFSIGQCLGRSNGNAVSCMDAHGVEIFDGAHDDKIIGSIPHDLQLVFLPSQDGLFDQNFVDRAGVQSPLGRLGKFFLVVDNTSTDASESKRGSDDQWKTNGFSQFICLFHGVYTAPIGNVQTDLFHGVAKKVPVFCKLDGFQIGTDEFYTVLFQDPAFGQLHGQVQTGLTTDSRQQGIRAFFFNDFGDDIGL